MTQKIIIRGEHDKSTKNTERFAIIDPDTNRQYGSIYLPKGTKWVEVTMEFE